MGAMAHWLGGLPSDLVFWALIVPAPAFPLVKWALRKNNPRFLMLLPMLAGGIAATAFAGVIVHVLIHRLVDFDVMLIFWVVALPLVAYSIVRVAIEDWRPGCVLLLPLVGWWGVAMAYGGPRQSPVTINLLGAFPFMVLWAAGLSLAAFSCIGSAWREKKLLPLLWLPPVAAVAALVAYGFTALLSSAYKEF